MGSTKFNLSLRVFPGMNDRIDTERVTQILRISENEDPLTEIEMPEDPTAEALCLSFTPLEEPLDYEQRANFREQSIQRAIAWFKRRSTEQFDTVRSLRFETDVFLMLGTLDLIIPVELSNELSRLKLELRIFNLKDSK